MFLGGVGEIGKNMTAFEYENDIIIVDAGLSFPNEELPGVDLVIPDITYLKENRSKIRGVILTHGHEDHIGSVPYFLKEIKVPLYGTKLTLTLTENKLKEHRINDAELKYIKPRSRIKLGVFEIEFISVNHSISGSVALSITTPPGVVFMTGDFKVDFTPVSGEGIDLTRIAEIGKKGVLLMMSDSTNIEREGYTVSERSVGETFDGLFSHNMDRRIIIATFASNVHRLQQIIDVSKKYGRKVAFSGRSMLNVLEAASRIGELKVDKSQIVDIDKISNIPDKNLTIISTGSQGEPMSALTRMAAGEFNKVIIGANDTIIISASPIPGNERMVYRVINNLYKLGAQVIYSKLEKVHVSGHACKEEAKLILSLVKPKFFIPVHGEYRHLIQHKELAVSMGVKPQNIIIPEMGHTIEVDKNVLKKGKEIPAGSLLVDGSGIEDIGSIILRDRIKLSEDGMILVAVGLNAGAEIITGPEIIMRGFISSESDKLSDSLKQSITSLINRLDFKDLNRSEMQATLRKEIKNFIFKKTKASPLIIPFIMQI